MVNTFFFPTAQSANMEDFWLNFGDDPNPPLRNKILYLTIQEVAVVGPATFSTMGVCDTLGVTYPMVNHYFGNRDGLIAEAAHVAYKLYIERIWDGVSESEPNPEARLRAWLLSTISLNVEIQGWGAVLNYPRYSSAIENIMEEKFGEERTRYFELNISRLTRLVMDLRENTITTIDYTPESYPRQEFLVQRDVIGIVSTIALSILGVAVWKSGSHSPSKGIKDLHDMSEFIIETHIQNMLKLALQ